MISKEQNGRWKCEETQAAEPDSEGKEGAPGLLVPAGQLPAEIESALFAEARLAGASAEPIEELPVLPLAEAVEKQQTVEEAAVLAPPPPEASDLVAGVLPPRPLHMLWPTEAAEPVATQEASSPELAAPEEPPGPLPVQEAAPPLTPTPGKAGRGGAESGRYWWWMAAWALLWSTVFCAVLVSLAIGWLSGLLPPASTGSGALDPWIFLGAIMWGGIGGVMALWHHIWQQARQPKVALPTLTCISQPFLGAILGGAVYCGVQLVLLMLGIGLVVFGAGDGVLVVPAIANLAIFLMACVVGQNEDRVLAILDHAGQRIGIGRGTAHAARPPTQQTGQ